MRHKYFIFTLLLLFIFNFSAKSQIEFENLVIAYAEGDYEKCANKAYRYTQKDKTKKHPLPYIYLSMANLKMSQNAELLEEYPKSFKDAVKYAAKYRRKDKTGEYYNDYIDHFEELKKIVIEECENYLLTDDENDFKKGVRKSYSLVKKVAKFAPEDNGIRLYKGVLELYSNNRAEAKQTLEGIDTLVQNSLSNFENLTEMEQYSIRLGLMAYAKYYEDKEEYDNAIKWLEMGKDYYYKDQEEYKREYTSNYKDLYNELNKS